MNLKMKYQRELEITQAKLDALNEFPEIRENTDRWGIVRLFGSMINSKVDQLEIFPACDCCADAEIYCYPYISYKAIQLFASSKENKPFFIIGKRKDGHIKFNKSWFGEMEKSGIPDYTLEKIWDYVDGKQEEEDEYGDSGGYPQINLNNFQEGQTLYLGDG
jgi:hypothetical protein